MLKGALSSVAETNDTARGVVVNLPGILFDLNKATLKVPAQITVAKLAGILMVFRTMNLSIEGYTDATGSDETNMKLSTDRAKTVYDFLQAQGISPRADEIPGIRVGQPGRPQRHRGQPGQENRRVEVVIDQAPKTE